MKRTFAGLLVLAALIACVAPNQNPPPSVAVPTTRVLGKLELRFGDDGLRTQAVIGDGTVNFDVTNRVFTSLDDAVNDVRYLSVRFPVTNISASTIENLTLYAYTQAGVSQLGTAVKSITSFGGAPASSSALDVKPTHGTRTNSGSIVVDDNAADFQVFTTQEAGAVTNEARTAGVIGANDRALEYGFVARSGMNRGFAPNASGTLTLGVRVPRGDSSTPYRFSMTFIVVKETATRVTRGPYPPETTANAETRAAAIADRASVTKEVALVGSDADTVSGANLTGLRRTNALISSLPGVLLGSCASGVSAATVVPAAGQARLGLGAGSPSALSGVVGDTSDPALNPGASFTLADADTQAGCLTLSVSSSNQAVVPSGGLSFDATSGDGTRTLKITPMAAGFSTITVSATDGNQGGQYVIDYAASAASGNAATRWHTGSSDASSAVAVDGGTLLVADDENQALRLYDRTQSGAPLASFDFTSSLGLTDSSGGVLREVDIEASTRVGNRIYWLGSHSNASSGNNRPNRSRLFATDLTGTGSSATLSYVGRYDGLKTDLLAWDSSNAHGLGANYFGLTASAATGVAPESSDGGGFNIEALSFAPGSATTAYVAFRAPVVPASARTRALVVPVTNFASLVNANPSAGPASFGAPIQLELGGRGLRSLECNAVGCLIVAGPHDGATGVAPKDFRLYTWTGNAADAPVLRAADLTALGSSGSFEGIADLPGGALSTWDAQTVQLISDMGDTVYYNNGVIAKDLTQAAWKKSRSDRVTVGAPVTQADFSLTATTPNSVATFGGSVTSTVTITGQNGFSDSVTLSASGLPSGVNASFSPNPATASSTLTLTVASGISAGTYPITVTGSSTTLTRTTNLTLAVRSGAAFTVGNLVVYRVGNGSSALGSTATAAFLDEYTTTGTLVQSVPLPTAASGSSLPLTNSGSATSEGALARSTDGRFLSFAGYAAAPGTAGIAGTLSTATARVIGRADNAGAIDTSTRITDAFSGNNVRGAVTNDGSGFWVVGATSGVRYVTLGSTGSSSDISTTVANLRTVNIFGGQLYVSTGSGSTLRVGTVGTGTPSTSGQTTTNLTGFPLTGSPYAFFFADLSSSVAGLDTLYVADDASGLQKYSLVGGSWTSNGAIANTNLRGLTASVSGTTMMLFGSTGSSIVTLTDSSGYNVPNNGSFLSVATAGTNTAFRGIAFAPQP